MRFVDTNVLLYAVIGEAEYERKRLIALDLLARRDLALSVQVLQEFYVQSTRPSRLGALSHGEAVAFAVALARYPVQSITIDVMREAFALCERFSLSYWDAAILAAAMVAGCDAVYSEDMSSEQDYDGLRVINPFI